MIQPATRQASHAALERFLDSLDSPFREIAALDGEQSREPEPRDIDDGRHAIPAEI